MIELHQASPARRRRVGLNTPPERSTLQRITQGRPKLRTLRQIVDEVYRLFNRRCRTDTTLGKLTWLRQRDRRIPAVDRTLKKLFSPTLVQCSLIAMRYKCYLR